MNSQDRLTHLLQILKARKQTPAMQERILRVENELKNLTANSRVNVPALTIDVPIIEPQKKKKKILQEVEVDE